MFFQPPGYSLLVMVLHQFRQIPRLCEHWRHYFSGFQVDFLVVEVSRLVAKHRHQDESRVQVLLLRGYHETGGFFELAHEVELAPRVQEPRHTDQSDSAEQHNFIRAYRHRSLHRRPSTEW